MEFESTNSFINDDFLLENKFSKILFHEYAANMPIIDYHNHLLPSVISENKNFSSINSAWLDEDHYKWRVMRALGIDENEITGDASEKIKFNKWAEAVPMTVRNPIFHWTHLELKRYFNINKLLQPSNSEEIFNQTNELIRKIKPVDLLVKFNVKTLCTTDDPIDDLLSHIKISNTENRLKVLPGFRPDEALKISNENFINYLNKLSLISDLKIDSYESLLASLSKRIDYFHNNGCRISDHGLEHLYAEKYKKLEIEAIFNRRLFGKIPSKKEDFMFKSSLLFDLCKFYYNKGWTQQFHLGAIRNNNFYLLNKIGVDVGCDSIGDFSQAKMMSDFFNKLNSEGLLSNTIVYNLNPSMNEVFATMIGNFSSSKVSMQFGTAWWYLDQKDGMEKQINALSNMGVISKFIGMLTDSRSFLSFPRHEYFRRIICNMIGKDINKGILPSDIKFFGKMIQDISYNNADNYFKF